MIPLDEQADFAVHIGQNAFGIERVERQRNVAAFEAEGQRHQRAIRVGIKGCAGGFKRSCRGKLDKIGAKAKICTYRGQGYALEV